ncbi:alginate lyase family protein [candidate division KSB1 bacterium]|nr:alginate lyase family protein [candidate division KSB1 bacterium]
MLSQPRTFLLDAAALAKVKRYINESKEPYSSAYAASLKDAEKALTAGPFSVVNKTVTPPSGDKHDFYNYGPYWWPDSTKPDGLPYIRRDGEVNPETQSDKFDDQSMSKMTSAVETLALAFFFSGDEKYARHAVELLRVWFLKSATKMNPHLEYSQAIPGRVTGRGIGIIETVKFKHLIDAIGLLETSQNFSQEDGKGLREWFQAYLHWLRTSQHGKDEDNWYNNHGTWYDVQVAIFALFLGQDSLAKRVIEASKHRRLETQVRPDGSQPKELERTRSLSYSLYNLTAFFDLAKLGQHVGVDLWHYRGKDGVNIKSALDFLLPFYQDKKWPYEQITPIETTYERLIPLLKQAVKVYQEKQYNDVLMRLPVNLAAERATLLYAD